MHRIESLNAFIGCPEPGAEHPVQFLICRSCGTTAEIDDRRVADAIGRSATERGFTVERRVIEVSGLCLHCQDGRGRSRAHD